MAVPSKFGIQWKINNARDTLADGEAFSEELMHEGFLWNISMEKNGDWADYTLECGADHYGPWNCAIDVEIYVLKDSDAWPLAHKEKVHLDDNTYFVQFNKCNYWRHLNSSQIYCLHNTITFEFRITIIKSSGGYVRPSAVPRDISKFISPIETRNAILMIGEKKLVVSKEHLAMYSPVFKRMFFGDFMEKGKKEIEMKEIDFDEFVDLLQVLFPNGPDISDATVLHIAKLADRFLIKKVLQWCEQHLIASSIFPAEKKLQLADTYRFPKLRETCLLNEEFVSDFSHILT